MVKTIPDKEIVIGEQDGLRRRMLRGAYPMRSIKRSHTRFCQNGRRWAVGNTTSIEALISRGGV